MKPNGSSPPAEAASEARWAQLGVQGSAPNPGGRGGVLPSPRIPHPLFTMFTSVGKGEDTRGKERGSERGGGGAILTLGHFGSQNFGRNCTK